MSKSICCAPGCTENAEARVNGIWYCNKYYQRMYHHGDLELHPRGRTTRLEYDGGSAAKIITVKGDEIVIDSQDIGRAMRYSWCISKTGYAVATIDGKVTKMHRYLLDVTNSNIVVDHINGNPLDNRRENLRVCTAIENGRNLKLKRTNSSGATGVRKTAHGTWNARITVNRKDIHIGNFATKEEAIKARQAAERKYYGQFAPCVSRLTEVTVE